MDAVAVAAVGPAADAVDADPVADAMALIAVATAVVDDGAFFHHFQLANWVLLTKYPITITYLLARYK